MIGFPELKGGATVAKEVATFLHWFTTGDPYKSTNNDWFSWDEGGNNHSEEVS